MKKYVVAFLLLTVSASAAAYERITHKGLSEEAAKKSILGKNPTFLSQLGLRPQSIFDTNYNLFMTSEGRTESIIELIKFGADWEDGRGEKVQSTRHFFNPLNGEALSAGPFILPVSPFYIPRINGIRSPDWVLEDVAYDAGNLGLPQRFSYRFGRQYFFDALTRPTKSDRDDKWGLTFQTLGHVIHHIQDMAQPQHTRNDFHCDNAFCEGTGLLGGVKPSFEKWTKDNEDTSQYSGYDPVYTKEAPNGFKTPRMFWLGGGKGVAEFSNRNFFTAGTNVGVAGFPSPQVPTGSAQKIDVAIICDDAVQRGRIACPANLRGNMTFFATNVSDSLRANQSGSNPRATSRSIFDVDLKKRFLGLEAYSVNRFTYDATNDFTLRRAVGYSAGMINYFFRGDIDVVENTDLPGTYAIRNKGTETMTGTFGLYYDDAGDVRTLYKSWDLTIPAGGQVSVGAIEPPTSPVPKKANQCLLVFSGDMGEETRAMFGTGAVTAAAVSLNPSSNALYLTGISATSVLVHMRVDRNGTRVVTAEEFHPLRSIFVGNPNATSKAYLTKQVEFLNDGKDYRTRAVIVGRPQFPMVSQGYVFHGDVANPNSADYFSCPYQLCWQGSTSSSSGEYLYLFSLNVLDYDQRTAGINYSRYRMVNGAPEVDRSGSVTLPPLPTGLVGLSYAAAGKGQLLVSPDGRTIVGFKGTDANQQQFHYELRLTMGDTVTAEWVQTIRDPYSDTPGPRATITPAGVRTVVFPDECVPKDPPRSYDLTLSQHTRNSEAVRSQASTVFFDYQNGNLLSLRSESSSKSIGQENYVSQDGTISGGVACSPEIWAAEKISGSSLYYVEQTNSSVVRNGTAVSVQTSAFARNREVLSSSIPYGWPRPANFVVNYEYFGPLSGLNTPYQDNGPPVVPISGSYVLRALTSKLSDAIVLEMQGASQTIKIRDFVLPGGSGGPPPYVADASPLGELFFATSDLRVVIHDPRPNGIKQWVKPPSVVRLLGAVWM